MILLLESFLIQNFAICFESLTCTSIAGDEEEKAAVENQPWWKRVQQFNERHQIWDSWKWKRN